MKQLDIEIKMVSASGNIEWHMARYSIWSFLNDFRKTIHRWRDNEFIDASGEPIYKIVNVTPSTMKRLLHLISLNGRGLWYRWDFEDNNDLDQCGNPIIEGTHCFDWGSRHYWMKKEREKST